MAKPTENIFEGYFGKAMGGFDPLKSMGDFAKLASAYKWPGLDVRYLVETQRKNIDAFSGASRAALEATQAIARRQGEMIEEGLSGMTAALDALSKSGNVTDAQTRQAEFVKGACAKAMSNAHELIELAAQSGREAAEPLNRRFLEGLDEVKTWTDQTNPAAQAKR